MKAFQQVLWVEPGFPRACEVHLRLGLMLKVHADFDAALKHLTLALIDATTPASFSKLESKFSVFVPYDLAYALRKHNTREQLFTVNRAILLLKSYSCTTCCFLVCKFFFLFFFCFDTRYLFLKRHSYLVICKIND